MEAGSRPIRLIPVMAKPVVTGRGAEVAVAGSTVGGRVGGDTLVSVGAGDEVLVAVAVGDLGVEVGVSVGGTGVGVSVGGNGVLVAVEGIDVAVEVAVGTSWLALQAARNNNTTDVAEILKLVLFIALLKLSGTMFSASYQ